MRGAVAGLVVVVFDIILDFIWVGRGFCPRRTWQPVAIVGARYVMREQWLAKSAIPASVPQIQSKHTPIRSALSFLALDFQSRPLS